MNKKRNCNCWLGNISCYCDKDEIVINEVINEVINKKEKKVKKSLQDK